MSKVYRLIQFETVQENGKPYRRIRHIMENDTLSPLLEVAEDMGIDFQDIENVEVTEYDDCIKASHQRLYF